MFFLGTPLQAKLVRRALRFLSSYPARGITVGYVSWEPPAVCPVDGEGDPLVAHGWTTNLVPAGDANATQVCIEIPDAIVDLYAGQTVTIGGTTITLPTRAQLIALEGSLPADIRALRQTRRAPVL